MQRRIIAPALLLLAMLLSSCERHRGGTPGSPSLYSMDGRWVSTGGAGFELRLDLCERHGAITGDGTVTVPVRVGSPETRRVPVAASGANQGGELTIRIVSDEGLDEVFRGRFSHENLVSGHLGTMGFAMARDR